MSWFRGTFGVGQGCTSCRKLVSGWWGFFLQFLRIFLVSKAIKTEDWGLRKMHFCCRKAKNSCFAEKASIYSIFVANVAKNIFWESLLMRTSCKLCNPLTESHIIISERVPAQCPRPRQVNHWNEEVFQVPAKHIEHHQEAEETRWWFWGWN